MPDLPVPAEAIVVPKAALTAAEAKWRNLKERESDGRIEQEHRAELAEKERDEWKTQHGYAMEGQKSWQFTAEQNLERAERAEKEREKAQRSRLRHKAHAERAEADLAAEGDPLCVCQDTGARAIKGACPEHHGDACLINLPGYCIRATEDREARFRAEAKLAAAERRVEGFQEESRRWADRWARVENRALVEVFERAERAEAALAEALDVIEAVVAGIVTLDGARVVLRKHGRLP